MSTMLYYDYSYDCESDFLLEGIHTSQRRRDFVEVVLASVVVLSLSLSLALSLSLSLPRSRLALHRPGQSDPQPQGLLGLGHGPHAASRRPGVEDGMCAFVA